MASSNQEILSGNFNTKDVTLDYCNNYTNEHGQFMSLVFTYKGGKMDYIMNTGAILRALELYTKEHCVSTGIKLISKEDVPQVS